MLISTFVQIAAFLIVAAVTYQLTAGALAYAMRRSRAARLEKQRIAQFRQAVAECTTRADDVLEPAGGDFQWNGNRKFRIARRVFETTDRSICSFDLTPYDGQPIPAFKPGQFLTFDLAVPGAQKPVVRTYSISSSPAERQFYRVSIKRIAAPAEAPPGTPAGTASNFFHDRLHEGDVVLAKAPAGGFCLAENSQRPVVLVAGGVGLTPLVSMLDWLIATNSKREVWLFYGTGNRREHAMYGHLAGACKDRPNVRMVVAYSRPTSSCVKGIDYHIAGHVTADLLAPVVKARDCEIYLCGPAAMMGMLAKGLAKLGVRGADIKHEAFGGGPADGSQQTNDGPAKRTARTFRIKYSRSGKTVDWTQGSGSLLELAEANGVKSSCSCRQGLCGSCAVGLARGSVGYLRQPANEPASGLCLPCIAKPESDLVLEM